MYRTFVITRHAFLESIVQPIYTLLLLLGVAILVIFGALPFFTLGEDTVMYKSVALDVILLLVLVATLFSTSRSIFDEIEDRTMLTLMSKPIQRWEVLLGKYLGIILSAAMAIAVMGGVLWIVMRLRIAGDYQIYTRTLDDRDIKRLADYRAMHSAGIYASLVLVWLQVSVLAAIGVALSTRFSLVVNLPTVILLYIAGNLTRFLYPLPADASPLLRGLAAFVTTVLPYLAVFDQRDRTVYRPIRLHNTLFEGWSDAVNPWTIWTLVAMAALYAIAYIVFALAAGLWSFRTRELGGAEG